MFQYTCLNPIAEVGLQRFDGNYIKTDNINDADAILVRSAKMHEMGLTERVLAIARAGAGVNNIPLDRYGEQGIVVFNTPGANANGVKEMVIAGMLLAARDIVGGINWVNEQSRDGEIAKKAEKEKKKFAGTEISGKKLGIIGLGAIGQLVANAAIPLGMDVYGYDPYISVDAAWNLSRNVHHVKDVNEIYANCDYITIHVPALDSTKGMIGHDAISMMKNNVVILNFARDILVDQEAVIDALQQGKIRKYVTDFATPELLGVNNVIITPHLGASTQESEDNCAIAAVNELREYLENGNIKNSVNFPNCDMGKCTSGGRIVIAHRNIPNQLFQFTRIIGDFGININDMTDKSRGNLAYSILDIDRPAPEEVIDKLTKVEGVLKVRTIR